jgi:hypothetical protein
MTDQQMQGALIVLSKAIADPMLKAARETTIPPQSLLQCGLTAAIAVAVQSGLTTMQINHAFLIAIRAVEVANIEAKADRPRT